MLEVNRYGTNKENSNLWERCCFPCISSYPKNDEDKSNLDIGSLELFENIAYVMAKHGDKSVPDSPEEWLDNFPTFSIYQILPQLIELWGLNIKSEEVPKKK